MSNPNIRIAKQSKANTPYSLESLLVETQSRRCVFFINERGCADIWSPNTPLPLSLRRAVIRFNAELYKLIVQGDKRVCVNPMLHKRSQQRRADGVCRLCRHLDQSFTATSKTKRNDIAS